MKHKYVVSVTFKRGVKWNKKFPYFAGVLDWINKLGKYYEDFGEVDKIVVKNIQTRSTVEQDKEGDEMSEV